MSKIVAMYTLRVLPDEVKTKFKIKSQTRRDCISYAGDKGLLTFFVNSKGQLYFYITPCIQFVKADGNRLADFSLTNGGQNLSSVYIDDDFPEVGYGTPNAKRFLKDGTPNPQYPFRNYAYIFLMNHDLSEIEILIIKDGRNLIHNYYERFIDGDFNEEIKNLRKAAKPFFDYGLFD